MPGEAEKVDRLPGTLRAVRTALTDAEQPLTDLAAATGALRSGSNALGTATPDVRGVLREAPEPLDRVPGVSDDARPAVDDLADTFDEARVISAKLSDGLGSAAPPLRDLAPYAADLRTFFFDLSSGIASHDGWQHRLRLMLGAPGPGGLVSQLPDTNDPYPAPGMAIRKRDSTGGLLPGK